MRPALQLRTLLFGVLLMTAAAALLFHFFQRQLSGAWFAFGIHPEVLQSLERSLEDQKRLAELDPERRRVLRQRFEQTETLLQRLRILQHNRREIVRRYEQILLFAFAGTVILVTGAALWRQAGQAARLERLQRALTALAGGRTDVEVGEHRRDVIGRIAAMIERTSQVMARDRRRLASLENLSAWQEAARRHAHEMRTPLTGARLELSRLSGLLDAETLPADDIRQAARSAREELDRLGRFTQGFTSFARLPRPRREPCDLVALAEELVATFADAWPNLELRLEGSPGGGAAPLMARVDRDMLRQVLVNLCDNSSLALGERHGTVSVALAAGTDSATLDISDDGPGVDESVRRRLFEPYTTTRGIGEGMGLGLAISKKILLDHGGDLELFATSESGTTFRLSLPRDLGPAEDTPS